MAAKRSAQNLRREGYLGIWAVAALFNAILYGAFGLILAQIVDAMRTKVPHSE